MGDRTRISWADATWNPWIGCTKVSSGCAHCYAERENRRFNWNPDGWGPGRPRRLTSANNWKKPLRWARQAAEEGELRRVFCASLADVFDEEVSQRWRERLWALIDECADLEAMDGHGVGLEWMILTKRPENILAMLPDKWVRRPPSFLRLGVTTEDQVNWNRRVGAMLDAWHGKNFVSYEPALGPLHMTGSLWTEESWYPAPLRGGRIHWVLVGGESGPGCREMDIAWARLAIEQCRTAGVPVFMKQLGGHPDKRDRLGEWLEDLRVQELPEEDEG